MVDIKSSELKNFVGKDVTIYFPKVKEAEPQVSNNEIVEAWFGKEIKAKIVSVDEVDRSLKIFYNSKEAKISFDHIGEVTYDN